MQDLKASRVIFDSGVPLVQLPCTPVVTHFATTVPEMERYVGGRGPIGDYLLTIFKDYHKDHFAWSKVLWDMTAVAWLVNDQWLSSDLVHSPIVTITTPSALISQAHDPSGELRAQGPDLPGFFHEAGQIAEEINKARWTI